MEQPAPPTPETDAPSSLGVFRKILAVQRLIQPEEKKGKNTFQHYAFLSDEQIVNTVKKHSDTIGLIMLPSVEDVEIIAAESQKGTAVFRTKVKLRLEFIDPDTGSVYTTTWYGESHDSQDKGIQKAITSAIKYLYIKTFKIAVEDDTDKESTSVQRVASAPVYAAKTGQPGTFVKVCPECNKSHSGRYPKCLDCWKLAKNKAQAAAAPADDETPPDPEPTY